MSDTESRTMTDAVSRFLFEALDIRGALVQLGDSWRGMQAGRAYAPVTLALLGQMAAVTTLLGSQMKTPGRLVLQTQGHGVIRLLMVDCDEQLQLRGLAKAPADVPDLAPAQLLGDGRLVLTLQGAGEPYQSMVPLEGGSMGEIFENFLRLSDQQPARLWLGADESVACGLLLQKLPNADDRDVDGWNRIQQMAATLRLAELALPAAELLPRLFPEEDIRLYKPRMPRYHCPRDEGKVRDMLRSLGREELESILAEHGAIVIEDEICNHEYRFGAEVIEQLFPAAKRTLH